MKDQLENLLAPDGLLSRLLYIILFIAIFWVCKFILYALVIFQYLHLALTAEKHEKVTEFSTDFSVYLGQVSAYVTLASDEIPFPFRDWKTEPEKATDDTAAAKSTAEPEKTARPKVKPRKKAAAKKSSVKKTRKKTAGKTVKKSSAK